MMESLPETVLQQAGSKALIPPPKNARVRGRDADRDHAIQVIRGLGGDIQARSLWAKSSQSGLKTDFFNTFYATCILTIIIPLDMLLAV